MVDNLEPGFSWLNVLISAGGALAVIGGALSWFYGLIRKEHRAEAQVIAEEQVDKFKEIEFNPQLEQVYRLIQQHGGRLDHVERFDKEFGILKTEVKHVGEKVDALVETVKENARESSDQLTGAMNRLGEQRREDNQFIEKLIDAKIK